MGILILFFFNKPPTSSTLFKHRMIPNDFPRAAYVTMMVVSLPRHGLMTWGYHGLPSGELT